MRSICSPIFLYLAVVAALLPSARAATCSSVGSAGSAVYRCADSGSSTTNGTNLVDTLNAATLGDTIVLPAGVIFRTPSDTSGYIDFPAKAGSTGPYITVTSSKCAELPEGQIPSVADATKMAVLETGNETGVIRFRTNAHHYRVQCMDIRTGSSMYAANKWINGTLIAVEDVTAHDIIFDRFLCRPYEAKWNEENDANSQHWTVTTNQCAQPEGKNWKFRDFRIYGFHGWSNASAVSKKTVSAGTTSTAPSLTMTSHGLSGAYFAHITGGTGNWSRINGHALLTTSDSNTVTWVKRAMKVVVASNVATIQLLYQAPHYLQVGDAVTISGSTTTGLNGTYTVASTPDAWQFTVATSGVANGYYGNSNLWVNLVHDPAINIAVDSTGFGELTGTVVAAIATGDASLNSLCFMIIGGPGPVLIENGYTACQFSSVFTGGGSNYTPNTATLTNVTPTGATLSNTVGLRVGDYLAVQVALGAVAAGTLSVTNGSASITGSGTALNNGMTNIRIFGTASGQPYDQSSQITASSATAATLGATWQGDTASGLTFVATRDYKTVRITGISGNDVTWEKFGFGGLSSAGSGVVNTSGTTVTRVSGDYYDGDDGSIGGAQSGTYSPGLPITIGGTRYIIASRNSATQMTLTSSAGTQTNAVMTFVTKADSPGLGRWNGIQPSDITVRRVQLDKPAAGAYGGICKAAHELKSCVRCRFEGNTYTGVPCISFGHPLYNQQPGAAPWVTHRDSSYSYNLIRNSERLAVNNFADPYESATTSAPSAYQDTVKGAQNVVFAHNLSLTHQIYWTPISVASTPASVKYEHNTLLIKTGGLSPGPVVADNGCSVALNTSINYADIRNNLLFYGLSGMGSGSCWNSPTTTFHHNLLYDTRSIGCASILADDAGTGNQCSSTFGGLSLAGTCDDSGDNWKNCKLTSTFRAGADDGGDFGADVEAVEDHQNGWSFKAGLLDEMTSQPRASAFAIGSTRAAISFSKPITGPCTLTLYTDASRQIEHGDTNTSGEKACDRTGNVTAGNVVRFVLGTNTALADSTIYYYKIAVGSAVMVGSFTTRASGSGISYTFSRAMECGTDGATFGTSVAANTPYSVAAGNVRYCRESSPVGDVQMVVAP